MSQTPEERRANAAKRQAARKARESEAGRVRRPYFATPDEHTAIAAHLEALRSSRRKSDIIVAAPGDVLPEFRAEQDPDGYKIGDNYVAGLWVRRNIEAFIEDGNTAPTVTPDERAMLSDALTWWRAGVAAYYGGAEFDQNQSEAWQEGGLASQDNDFSHQEEGADDGQ